MSAAVIPVLVLVFLAFVLVGIREMMPVTLPNEDAAFKGSVKLGDLTPERVAEIAPLVDRISVITIDVGRNTKNPPINADAYEVFIIDVNGAIHDISRLNGPEQAADVARRASELLGAPIDDPDGLLPKASEGGPSRLE